MEKFIPPKGIGNLELSEITAIKEIRSMMDDFYRITKVPAAIMDRHNNILLSNGLQEICIKFHWIHPEANNDCPVSEYRQHGNPGIRQL